MKQALVLVEGQTEEVFVGRVLAPHLWAFDVHLQSKTVVTRRVRSGPDFKGGITSWNQVARDLRLLLHDSAAVAVTTLVDYYGLPPDWPGLASRPTGAALDRAEHVEAAMDAALGDARLRSNLLLHEFEALLYAEPEVCGRYLSNASLTVAMQDAVNACGGPELVNDGPATAPSKRLLAVHAPYRKTSDGPSVLEEIGLDPIRLACPHFDDWLSWLESL